jgi:hypothetical protein
MASYLDCMITMRKIILLFIFGFIVHQHSFAQNDVYEKIDTIKQEVYAPAVDEQIVETETDEKHEKKYDNFGEDVLGDTAVNFNEFKLSSDTINAWKESKKYSWIKTIDKQLKDFDAASKKDDDNNLDRGNKLIKGVSATEKFFNSGILRFILWSLAIALVVFIIYNLFLNKGFFSKGSKKAVVTIEEEIDENDMQNNFLALQQKAYAAGDTRLATRYLFLRMLQKLHEKELVKFGIDKTNTTYASELPASFRNDFSSLALYYEYIWYGKFAIEKDVFDKIADQYNQFLNRI